MPPRRSSTAPADERTAPAFCCTEARARGLDPIGQANPFDYYLLVETPLPWPRDKMTAAALPPEVGIIQRTLVRERYPVNWVKISVILVAPHPSTPAGQRRVFFLRRPSAPTGDLLAAADLPPAPGANDEPFARFVKDEYLVPDHETGALCWALTRDPAALERFGAYRQESAHVRELLVCTHGTVDAACARFGGGLFSQLSRLEREAAGEIRAWRCSHFGGHIFAPTLVELPSGRYWGYVDEEAADLIARQRGDITRLRGCYRGWSGHRSIWARVAEREAMLDQGWSWLQAEQSITILAEGPPLPSDDKQAPERAWGEVRLTYRDPMSGRSGTYEARVERAGPIVTPHSTATPDTLAYEQYRVRWLRHGS
jgi:hypothetical protein